jgi:DNA invertase Pin-like site-specific DNA recombinase
MTKILDGPAVAQSIAAPAGRRWGYGRVSTEQQTEAQQRAQLEAAGCDEVVTEQISSGKADRPGLAQVLGALQPGDQLVVAKLDRLARSLVELLAIAADLEDRGIDLVVLDQAIDTSTPAGRLMFQVLGAVSQFERELAIERTRASVAHRRATGGDLGGRRKSYSDEQLALGHRLRAEGQSISQIAAALGLSRGTTHRLLQEPEAATAS